MAENFYEKKQIITERVQLAEDISLPSNKDEYKNTDGKFFINIFTPLLDKSIIKSEQRSAPNNTGGKSNIKGSSYTQTNYITLTIPRYMLYQFDNVIPKGTEFIITCIGEFKIEHFRIIGLYSV